MLQRHSILFSLLIMAVALVSCMSRSEIDVRVDPEYNGSEVQLATYSDSVVFATATAADGRAVFDLDHLDTLGIQRLCRVVIDGRTRGSFILDTGKRLSVNCTDGTSTGSAANDFLTSIKAVADSIENTGDMSAYSSYLFGMISQARISKGLTEYCRIEGARFATLAQIDSLIAAERLKGPDVKALKRWRDAAALRDKTAPGRRFTDFCVMQPEGNKAALSDYAGHGRYILVQFWASWCPWCIKEIPELKKLQSRYPTSQFGIVGVAVRDEEADTRRAVQKFGISWPVIYNAARIPYDIYGFTGIPYLVLIGPDGTIVSAGESVDRIALYLDKAIGTGR